MSTTTISPNMNLPVPVPGEDPGPDWANNIVADMYAIDAHDHSNGKGVAITPDGLDINADLPFGGNNATELKSVRFEAQAAPLASGSDLGCLYEAGVDLYYNDGAGNQVRITQSGSVTGATGTITGLPSGTASASFAAGTFTFQSATATPATMAVGPLVVGRSVASSKTVSITPNAAQASNYDLTLPVALPVSTALISVDTSGNMSLVTETGTGDVVLSNSPTITTPQFSGNPTGSIVAASFTPTVAWSYVSGNVLTVTNSVRTFRYQRIGDIVSVTGRVTFSATGTGAGSLYTFIASLPFPTSVLLNAGSYTITSSGTPVTRNLTDNASGVQSGAAETIVPGFTFYLLMNYSYTVV